MGCVCCVCIESEMEGIVIAEEAVDNARETIAAMPEPSRNQSRNQFLLPIF